MTDPKKCPKCNLSNPPAAQHCDCGFNFVTGNVEDFIYVKSADISSNKTGNKNGNFYCLIPDRPVTGYEKFVAGIAKAGISHKLFRSANASFNNGEVIVSSSTDPSVGGTEVVVCKMQIKAIISVRISPLSIAKQSMGAFIRSLIWGGSLFLCLVIIGSIRHGIYGFFNNPIGLAIGLAGFIAIGIIFSYLPSVRKLERLLQIQLITSSNQVLVLTIKPETERAALAILSSNGLIVSGNIPSDKKQIFTKSRIVNTRNVLGAAIIMFTCGFIFTRYEYPGEIEPLKGAVADWYYKTKFAYGFVDKSKEFAHEAAVDLSHALSANAVLPPLNSPAVVFSDVNSDLVKRKWEGVNANVFDHQDYDLNFGKGFKPIIGGGRLTMPKSDLNDFELAKYVVLIRSELTPNTLEYKGGITHWHVVKWRLYIFLKDTHECIAVRVADLSNTPRSMLEQLHLTTGQIETEGNFFLKMIKRLI